MIQNGTTQDFLGRVFNLALYPTGANQRPTRLAQVSTPWIGTTINGSTILLEAHAYDPCDGIRQVAFYVFYNSQWHNVGTDTDGTDGWSIYWDASQVADQVIQVKAFAGDMAGNGVETPINDGILLDRKPPNVSSLVFSPTSALAGQSVTIAAVLTDNLSQSANTDVYIDPTTDGSAAWEAWRRVGTITGTTGSLIWNTAGFAPGPHKVILVLKDNAGNQAFWPTSGDTPIAYSLRFGVYLPVVLKAYAGAVGAVRADFSAVPTVGRPPLTIQSGSFFGDGDRSPMEFWRQDTGQR